jgi:hypothetical protein
MIRGLDRKIICRQTTGETANRLSRRHGPFDGDVAGSEALLRRLNFEDTSFRQLRGDEEPVPGEARRP